ncbi:MAG: RDD family protein [Planctomycetota bacterium]|nr:MAG: RDD family protein [Planctomycetota bacterium]
MESRPVWYYVRNGQRVGPVTEEVIAGLVRAGELSAEVPVWAPGLSDWTPAEQVLDLAAGSPPPAPTEPPPEPWPLAPPVGPPPAGPQRRPWVRYWARSIDLTALSLVGQTLLRPFGLPEGSALLEADQGLLLLEAALMVGWLLAAEAALLALAGTTPGKALLQVRVERLDGGRPTFLQALRRTLRVFVVGLGLFLPILSQVCMVVAWQRLRLFGVTWWDQADGLRVVHRPIGFGRAMLAAALLFWLSWLTFGPLPE